MLGHTLKMNPNYAEIHEIRKYLRPKGVPVRELSHFFGKIQVKKNRYDFNDAEEAKKWKPLTQRVRSVVSRSGFPVGRCSNPGHRKPSTGNKLSQHCEVLGPYYCTECIKHAHRNKYNIAINENFPRISMSKGNSDRSVTNPALSLTSVSLPALTADVTEVSPLSDASVGGRKIGHGYVTTTELQKRVMEKHRQRMLDVLISESTPDLSKEFTKSRKRTRFLDLPDL